MAEPLDNPVVAAKRRATVSMSARDLVSSNPALKMEAVMTPQESDLITILLDRLHKTEGQPQDPEAATLVRETTAVAGCALFPRANRADPGSEPARCAE
jgi:hypothetical protein